MTELTERDLRRMLIRANRSIRAVRPPLSEDANVYVRNYHAATGRSKRTVQMYQIWFRTRGCTYDRAGQCSMCNYGIGPEVEPTRIALSLRLALASVPENCHIYLSPSGSLLDDREVEPDLRDRLLRLVAGRRPALFAFESRPELFDPDRLDHIRDTLPTAALVGQIGVESWDPHIRTMCHLKPTPQRSYLGAVDLLNRRGFASIANVTLGGLGLSPREAYDDTLASVRGARSAGYTTQMVFPLSAKAGTLLGWAHDRDMWEPPTLWMLIRLLAECAADTADTAHGHGHDGHDGDGDGDEKGDLSISWFDPELDDVVRSRPDGCERCRPLLVETLTEFRKVPASRTLARALSWRGCDCPDRTDAALAAGTGDPGYTTRLAAIARAWQAANPAAGGRGNLLAQRF